MNVWMWALFALVVIAASLWVGAFRAQRRQERDTARKERELAQLEREKERVSEYYRSPRTVPTAISFPVGCTGISFDHRGVEPSRLAQPPVGGTRPHVPGTTIHGKPRQREPVSIATAGGDDGSAVATALLVMSATDSTPETQPSGSDYTETFSGGGGDFGGGGSSGSYDGGSSGGSSCSSSSSCGGSSGGSD